MKYLWICIFTLLVAGWGMAQGTKIISGTIYEVNVPVTWEEARTPGSVYLLYPGKDVTTPERDNINITPTVNSDGMSMDSYTFMAKHGIESRYPEVNLNSSKPAKLGAMSGHRFEYRGMMNGKKYLVIQVMALHGKHGFTVQFSGTEDDFKVVRGPFEQMIRTFKAL